MGGKLPVISSAEIDHNGALSLLFNIFDSFFKQPLNHCGGLDQLAANQLLCQMQGKLF